MIHSVPLWLLVAGLFGAGFYNALGTAATKSDFARWGYPRWWGRFTGALEMVCAVLIAFPASRIVGLALGAAIILAAILTVLRHREFSHIVPLGAFAALIALTATFS
jgi:hypothetical protein